MDLTAVMVSTLMQNYISAVGAVFILTTVLALIVYLFGSLLMNDKIKLWAKMEIYEIIFSAIIILMIFSLVPVATEITNAALNIGTNGQTTTYMKFATPSGYVEKKVDICGDQTQLPPGYENISACHVRLAVYYFRVIYDEGRKFGYDVLWTYSWTSMLGDTSVTIQTIFEKMGMVMWVPWKGFYTLRNQVLEFCFNWATTMMFIAKFQEILLKFFAIAGFPVSLVLGGLLRTFTFTRRLGGLLIGLSIAMYFIYPAIYALGGLLIIQIKENARDAWLKSPANPGGSMDPPIINTLYINSSTAGLSIGGVKIMDDYKDVQKINAELESMTPEERERFIREKALTTGFDLGKKIEDEKEKENLLIRIAKFVYEFFKYLLTHNPFVDTVLEWRDNGHIEVVSRLTFFSLVFLIFSIFGTIAAARSLAMTFGGDIEFAGLTRLI